MALSDNHAGQSSVVSNGKNVEKQKPCAPSSNDAPSPKKDNVQKQDQPPSKEVAADHGEKPATPGKGATLKRESITIDNSKISVSAVRNLNEALQADKLTAAISTLVKFSREKDGLKCIAWAKRGKKAVVITPSGDLELTPRPPSVTIGYVPYYSTDSDYEKAGIKIYMGPTDEGLQLRIRSGTKENRVVVGDFREGESKLVPGYRFAAVFKMKRDHVTPVSVLIIDTEQVRLAGEVPLPTDMSINQPKFVLDPVTNALAVMDNDLKWLMVVDLQPLTEK
ncbi:MAG: hypothetical protein V1899_04590 [Planctomycetota bacterium]